ncbi:MAG: alpha/beta fold hydrolase [Bacteroidota bacterium]|jgi:pimeloyl-ACP methyl ester carboxylesterase
MKTNVVHILLILFTFSFWGCKPYESDYSEFKEEPAYLTNSNTERQRYYSAYNQVMALWKVDFQELYIPVKHGTAHVIVAGDEDAEPLVLLHGMNASSAMWYPNIRELSTAYRVFAIDLITEPGKSAPNTAIDDNETLMLWYESILKKLKLEKYYLLGASKGGWLAAKLAIHLPEQVKKLVLLSPAQTFIWMPPDKALITNVIYEIAPTRERLEKLFGQMSTHPEQIPPAFLDLFHQASKLSAIDKLLMEMQPLSDNELQRLDMPALVLIGDQDIINNARSLQRAREFMPRVNTEIVEDAGHFLSLDRGEYVNETILRFLEE